MTGVIKQQHTSDLKLSVTTLHPIQVFTRSQGNEFIHSESETGLNFMVLIPGETAVVFNEMKLPVVK